MTWFKVDDSFSLHTKARAAGRIGRALWYEAGQGCAREDLEGIVRSHMLPMYGSLAEVAWKKGSQLLVVAGLWHPADALCGACLDARDERRVWMENRDMEVLELVAGDFYFHDWLEYQVDKESKDDPIQRKRADRKRNLWKTATGKAIIAAVRERDQDLCRYCGHLTVWSKGRGGDTRSDFAGTIDHRNPFDWVNSPANCVVACRTCNGRKRDRTPEQWVQSGEEGAKPLLPAPKPYKPGPKADQSQSFGPAPETNGGARAPARGGPGSGPASVRLRSGLAGTPAGTRPPSDLDKALRAPEDEMQRRRAGLKGGKP